MAVKLGNMVANANKQEILKKSEHDMRLAYLYNLIEQAEDLVEDVKDIRDTYFYIKENMEEDKEFYDGLWAYLCKEDKEVYSGSFFVFENKNTNYGKPSQHHKLFISRHGVCIKYDVNHNYLVTNKPSWDSNHHDKNIWYGKYLAKDYFDDHNVSTNDLNDYIANLEMLIKYFPCTKDEFFHLVDTHTTYKR